MWTARSRLPWHPGTPVVLPIPGIAMGPKEISGPSISNFIPVPIHWCFTWAIGNDTAVCGKVKCNTEVPFMMVSTYGRFQRMLLISHPSFVRDHLRQSLPEDLMALQTCTSALLC